MYEDMLVYAHSYIEGDLRRLNEIPAAMLRRGERYLVSARVKHAVAPIAAARAPRLGHRVRVELQSVLETLQPVVRVPHFHNHPGRAGKAPGLLGQGVHEFFAIHVD